MDDCLAPYATHNNNIQLCSREHPTTIPTIRTEFERDRDRILHSKAFKRLAHKTQVFIYDGGDHHRNRLTHTIEVESISNSISSTLKLNNFLCSAIALAHDLGATPFGKSGEKKLNELTKKQRLGEFRHNHQGIRVVEKLENQYPNYLGLNLTLAVKEGILKHKVIDIKSLSLHSKHLTKNIPADKYFDVPSTLEGQAVREADNIVQIYHYIEDGLRYNLIPQGAIFESSLWKSCSYYMNNKYKVKYDKFTAVTSDDIKKLTICRFLVKFMVSSLISSSLDNINRIGGNNIQSGRVRNNIIKFDDETAKLIKQFNDEIISNYIAQHNIFVIMSRKWETLIESIFNSYLKCPEQLPPSTLHLYNIAKEKEGNVELRVIVDHIAGMTDRYAIKIYKDLFDVDQKIIFS